MHHPVVISSTVVDVALGVHILQEAFAGIGVLEAHDKQVSLLDDVEFVDGFP